MSRQAASFLEELGANPAPTLHPIPTDGRGFRVRVDLHGAKPPVWRRLELPGDLTLPRVHDALQAAMGWTDTHLHRFRTGSDHRAPYFITEFDLSEGETGTLESDVRLDQILAEKGDQLWYEYDFGDGWEHKLVVEAVLDSAPEVRCTAGRMACPPEDCGGLWGHAEIAAWVRSDYDDELLPQAFEDAAHGRSWLPPDWHPDRFDLDETNAALSAALAEPVTVTGELADLADQLERAGIRSLRQLLAHPLAHGPIEVSDAAASRLTETYRTFLDVVDDGVALTSAGNLPPALAREVADRTGVSDWWRGRRTREDHIFPVAEIRATARALGLVSLRKGRLAPTVAARRCAGDPQALLRHIIGRLPVGTDESERQAGWMALAVLGSGTPPERWHPTISELLHGLGWYVGDDLPPHADSETLTVLQLLGGAARHGWGQATELDPDVAATARAVIRGRG